MLTVNRISKRFGSNFILDEVNLHLVDGEHAALIGANGSGKSTLLEIVAGKIEADSGSVVTGSDDQIGYLPQGLFGHNPVDVGSLFVEANDRSMLSPGQSAEAQRLLAGLGLGSLKLNTAMDRLSGGEQKRVQLAALLFQRPEILLLDEPTNHLDIEAMEWLEKFIVDYRGAILLVSHDRVFLDRTIDCVYELDDQSHRIRRFPGNYSLYAHTRNIELEKAWEKWKDQEDEVRRLKADWHNTSEQARWSEQATRDSKLRRYAKKVAKKGKAKEKRLEKFLESEERVEKPKQRWRLNINFAEPDHQSQLILQAENLTFGYNSDHLFEQLNLLIRPGERIALIGPNGCGKSTLLKVLLGELPVENGCVRWADSVCLGYMPQQQENLPENLTSLEHIQQIKPMELSETYRFLHYFLLEEQVVNLPIGILSYGQRARLLLARLLAEGANFLVMDEPVNHLDIPSREQFEQALAVFTGGLLLVAHDRAFIARITTQTWRLREGGIQKGYSADLVSDK